MPIDNQTLAKQLSAEIGGEVLVESQDQHHFTVTVISDMFSGKSRIQRQQLIYQGLLGQYIRDGIVHAVELKTYTLTEWKQI